MARGRPSQRGNATRARGRNVHPDPGVNAAFRDMLAEVESSPTQTGDEGRPIKKRRVRGRIVAQGEDKNSATDAHEALQQPAAKHRRETSGGFGADVNSRQPVATLHREQTAYKDESSEENDFAWEEVELGQDQLHAADDEVDNEEDGPLQLVLDDGAKERSRQVAAARRKPLTAIERSFRLQVHKVHLLCLLSHVHMRNHWCNDQNVHKVLYRALPKQIVSLLNPDDNYAEFRQGESFKEGLKKVGEYFRDAFTTTARGMSRPYWVEDSEDTPQQPPSDLDLPMQKSDFLDCAKTLKGSRDIGTQLLCALLRSANVETRLVCSLQVLPLTGSTKGATPQKPPSKPIPVVDYNLPSSDNDSDHHLKSSSPAPTLTKRPIGSTGGLTRFSNPNAPIPPTSAPPPRPKPRPKKFRESPHPIFWLEVLNPISKKYTPIDALVTHTINKPSALTPSLSDPQNTFTYIIAFNDDLTAKDVTRRYTRQYAAKILRQRVDSTATGKTWLASVLKLFRYPDHMPSKHELAEDDELAKREASEPMPRAIQDFKNHPTFALERHLKRNEIIHPRNEVGRVNTAGAAGGKISSSSTNSAKSESVFRRKDVLVCRSADAWFRQGRVVKKGEQPLKRLPAPSSSISRRRARRSPSPNFNHEENGEEEAETSKPLYAPHQTHLYLPPPIPPSGYPLPRNPYNNLDLYTASMLPPRAHHSPSPLTASAATILGIDYVPAVTGFVFQGKAGRRGKAVVQGAVVWEGHREAVEAVVGGLEEGEREEGERRRGVFVMGVWGRMVRGLRVRERVRGYRVEGEREEAQFSEEVEDSGSEDEDEGGGFLPERGGEVAVPTAAREDGRAEGRRRTGGRRMLLDEEESEESDVYVPSDGKDEEEMSTKDRDRHPHRRGRERSESDGGSGAGGFVRGDIMDDDDVGGGFLPDDQDPEKQGEDDDVGGGGGFVPEGDNHEHDGEEEDMGGGFIIEYHAKTPPRSTESAPEEEEEAPEEKMLGLNKKSIEPSQQRATQQSQSSHIPLAEKDFGAIDNKNVATMKRFSSTAEEETETETHAFRTDEDEERRKHPGDILGLSGAEINEAAAVENEFFELRAQGAGPPLKRPAQERQDKMNELNDVVADADADGGGPKKPWMGQTDDVEVDDEEEVVDIEEAEAEAEAEGEPDDKGSLLSEDPSDEDAEPEWLA